MTTGPETTPIDPAAAARAAGLRYSRDDRPGIKRRRRGKGFTYLNPDGQPVGDSDTLERIRALAIPPAWADVWICPHPNGHLQATGRDQRGRKQYRYHSRRRATRDESKYERLVAFGLALPKLRARVEEDLAKPGLPREKILATVVRLLEVTLIRVGNEEYARSNGSFGLTTLRGRHVEVDASTIRFAFRGKSGVRHRIDVRDRRLARIVTRLQELPGQDLFNYVEGDEARAVDSADVNDYLREAMGEGFTAKDFRTFAGTVLAAKALQAFEGFDSQAQAKRNLVTAIESVARRLGNTPSVCRQCYVHPAVVDAYLDGTLAESLRGQIERELAGHLHELPAEEAAVLAFLHGRLAAG